MSPKDKPTKPLAAYTRVSRLGSRDEEELMSHDLQRERIALHARAHDLDLLDERFEDTDASGGKMDRPAYNRVMAGIRAGEYGGIVVAKLDRFARTVAGALRDIREIEDAGGAFVSLDPPIDTSTATGRFILTVFLALGAMERERVAEGTAAVHRRKIEEEGVHQAGAAPAGYRFTSNGTNGKGKSIRGKLEPNGSADAVRAAFDLRARGATIADVKSLLEEAGVPTSREGESWSQRATAKMLHNPVYLGEARSGEYRNAGAHEPLVDRATWEAVQRTFRTREPRNGSEPGLLAGLARCDNCGRAMYYDVARRNTSPYPFLTCRSEGCSKPRPAIGRAVLEPYVVEAALRHLGTVRTERRGSVDTNALEEALRRAESEEEAFVLHTPAAARGYAEGLALRQAATGAAREELARAGGAGQVSVRWFAGPDTDEEGYHEGTSDIFERMALADKRAFLGEVVREARVRPGRGRVAERVEIEFTDGTLYVPLDLATTQALAGTKEVTA